MRLAIKDANIIFDLLEIDLMDFFFELDIEVAIPDLIVKNEIKIPEQKEKILNLITEK